MIERSEMEEVDALPVLPSEPVPHALVHRSVSPTVQTAAVAASGFVVGALVVRVFGRRHQRAIAARHARQLGRSKRTPRELLEIVGSRSLLVDVHLLGTPARGR